MLLWRSLLQAAFTQLLLHYNRFLELCKRQVGAAVALWPWEQLLMCFWATSTSLLLSGPPEATCWAHPCMTSSAGLQASLPVLLLPPTSAPVLRYSHRLLQGAAGLGVAQQSVTLPSIMYFLKQYSR